ncbi:MAG: chemotaxis protein CheD [Alphaproteobacteria bacterium]|nr:chemotaxis protein CheD [Alphaproteobacteria bacterium]MBU1515838.1 chemotaxis protein CheD [Alphaproteobacteria bacterium]MBU2094060.1 chemotaxis protein CheD [Alphaproteobacteria bacterium]MBU2151412.1 chemotaxis protein CheD [Alphaproteobacteria bacterium]MBU2305312.1 chemotaxis protein CheD [Alphaproteobacteria bacterium]
MGRSDEAYAAEPRKIHVIQGEFHVARGDDVVLTTILGSCVAACIRDPITGYGGMNHFLLPGEAGDEGMRYGVQSMELLLNDLLRKGCRRERMEVKLFGGAHLFDGLSDVGGQNSTFAERFVRDEGLRHVGGSLRGDRARRIQYWPSSGRARQILLAPTEARVFDTERRKPVAPVQDSGALELF